jgi:glycosyltransferase involved in cell wall biosynthesis
LKNKKNELLFVGRVDCLYKQVDLLLVIWSKLHIDFPDWELKIVGGGRTLSGRRPGNFLALSAVRRQPLEK